MMKKLLCTFLIAFIAIVSAQAQADINVLGNSNTIANGADTPDLSNHTSFGTVSVGSSLTRTYTIQNTGDADLNLTGLGFSFGSDPQFSINTSGTTSPIAGGGSTTFAITFTPTATGSASAVISLSSNDPDESPYTFTVGGDGTVVASDQDINLQGNGNDINNGGTPSLTNHTNFGSVALGSSVVRTFTIQNTGGSDLNLTLLGFGFGTDSQFAINTSGTTSPISGGSSTTFTVTYTATTVGLANGSISISSNDPDENPYVFDILATGVDSPNINLQGNGNDIDNGGSPSLTNHTDFGDVSVGSSLIRTFTIQNTGSQNLSLSFLGFGFGSNPQFTINSSSTTSPITGGSSTTFTVTFTPTVIGVANGTISISSNDPDESPYTFGITANAIGVPDINLQGNGNDIGNGSSPDVNNHTNFGDVSVGASLTRTFTIQNTGDEDLTLSLLGFGFGTNSQFTINSVGTTSPITGGSSTTFEVTFTPTTAGLANGTLSISSNDPDESPYTFAISANGIIDDEPEINLLDNTNAPIVSGGSINFGSQDVSLGNETFTFTIQNLGSTDLNLTDPSPFVVISGANASDFTLGTVPSSTIAPSGSTTFTMTFDPVAIGPRTASVSIANNDSDENPYTFTLTGEGIDANASSPLLITQYYENGNNDYIEVKNISGSAVPQQLYLCIYRNLRTTTSIISTQAPDASIQIPALSAGQVIVFKNPSASDSGISTPVCDFDGNDVILISTDNNASAFAGRLDIVGIVGNTSPPVWGANTSYIKGCGTNESPSLVFDVTINTPTSVDVNDYIKLTTSEVDLASASTNLFLGTQTIGSTTWTSSWSNGIPDKTKSALISGTYSSGNGSFESCDLTINPSGAINFTSTSNFIKVNNDLTINGSFVLGDQAALVTVNEAASITGVITKQESTTTLKQYDFTYWSSPVQSATTSVFTSTGAPAGRIFEWRKPSTGDFGGWVAKSGSLEVGRGYISEGPDGATQHNIAFTGKPNNGVIGVGVGYDTTTADGAGGFNLIGNPFPCAIDIDLFLGKDPQVDTSIFGGLNGSIDATIWLWTHKTEYQDNPGEDNDYTVDDYATYNFSGGVTGSGSGLASASGSSIPTKNIGSAQGFFIKTTKPGDVFFTSSMKLDGQNTQFFRNNDTKNKLDVAKNRMWLNVISEKGGAFNQILVGFFDKATDGVDRGYDGEKFSAGNYISLYSNIDDKKYTIQGLGTYSSDKKVSIGFDSSIKEKFSISIYKLEGVLENEEIYLVDNYLNIVHDLKASDYKFEITEVGNFADRFTLQFNKSVLSTGEEELANSFIVSNDNEDLRVKAGTNVTDIKVYDMLGRLLINQKPNKSDFRIKSSVSNGTVLIVNATLDNGAEVSKKVIKH